MHPSFTPKAHWVTLAMVISLRCPTLAVPSKTKRPSERTAKRSYLKDKLVEKFPWESQFTASFFDMNFLSLPPSLYKNHNKSNLLEKGHHPNSPFQFNPGHPNVPSKSFVASSHWSPKRHVQVGDVPPPNRHKIAGWLLRYEKPPKNGHQASRFLRVRCPGLIPLSQRKVPMAH